MRAKALIALFLIALMLIIGLFMFPDADPTTEEAPVATEQTGPQWATDIGLKPTGEVLPEAGKTFFATTEDAERLSKIGLKDAENGDQIEIQVLEDDKWILKDLRTEQEIEITYVINQAN